MITAHPHALVSSDVTRNTFTTNSGLIIIIKFDLGHYAVYGKYINFVVYYAAKMSSIIITMFIQFLWLVQLEALWSHASRIMIQVHAIQTVNEDKKGEPSQ